MWPHRRRPTRLPHPWDSPGKNTGVGCHFLLQCMKVKRESEVAQSCPTLHNPMVCSLPDSSVHGIFQARVLEWAGGGLKGRWYLYNYSWFALLYGRNQHNTNLPPIKKKVAIWTNLEFSRISPFVQKVSAIKKKKKLVLSIHSHCVYLQWNNFLLGGSAQKLQDMTWTFSSDFERPNWLQFSSVQFSCSVLSDSLWPH